MAKMIEWTMRAGRGTEEVSGYVYKQNLGAYFATAPITREIIPGN